MDPSPYIRSTTTEMGTVHLHEDGFVVIDQKAHSLHTWDTACEMMTAGANMVPEGELAAMVVVANHSRTDRDARRAFQEVGGEILACVALVINSRVSEVTGNFFLRINKPPYPMKLFSDVESAGVWAAQHVGKPR